jgi:hypothetical protein
VAEFCHPTGQSRRPHPRQIGDIPVVNQDVHLVSNGDDGAVLLAWITLSRVAEGSVTK